MTRTWQAGDFGLCWLKGCKGTGLRREVNGHELVLCFGHSIELEAKAVSGYSQAEPPSTDDSWWPWKEV